MLFGIRFSFKAHNPVNKLTSKSWYTLKRNIADAL